MKRIIGFVLAICMLACSGALTALAETRDDNYMKLVSFVNKTPDSFVDTDGRRTLAYEIPAEDGYTFTYGVKLLNNGVRFFLLQENTGKEYIECATFFDYAPVVEIVDIRHAEALVQNGKSMDNVDVTLGIPVMTFSDKREYKVTEGGEKNLLSRGDVCTILNAQLLLLFTAIDTQMYQDLGFGFKGLGFASYDGNGEDSADMRSCLFGDVNGDKKINASDALLALKFAVGKCDLTTEQFIAGDVDGSAWINASDALYILKFAVGKTKKFPVTK